MLEARKAGRDKVFGGVIIGGLLALNVVLLTLFFSQGAGQVAPVATPTVTGIATVATQLAAAPTSTGVPSPTVAQAAASPTSDPALPLLGRRIGLDPGHGPRRDLGAVYLDPDTGRLALAETEFNLDVAVRCRVLLEALGAEVVLTRENEETFITPWPNDANDDGIEGGTSDDLQTRVDILNDFGAEVFVSIHANSAPNAASRQDLQMLYCGADDCLFPAENKRVAELARTHLLARMEETGYTVNGTRVANDLAIDDSDQHYFVLGPASGETHPRGTQMPGIIGETLYVTLPSGAAQLNRDEMRQAIAQGYVDALAAFLLETE